MRKTLVVLVVIVEIVVCIYAVTKPLANDTLVFFMMVCAVGAVGCTWATLFSDYVMIERYNREKNHAYFVKEYRTNTELVFFPLFLIPFSAFIAFIA